MSRNYYTVNGYGLSVDKLNISLPVLVKLLDAAPDTKANALDFLADGLAPGIPAPKTIEGLLSSKPKGSKEYDDENSVIIDSFDNYEDDSGFHGIHCLITEMINEAENILLEAVTSGEGEQYILLTPAYPWNGISDREKSLSEKEMQDIFNKYLGVFSDKPLDIGYFEVEVF